jgi:hypothetical protein
MRQLTKLTIGDLRPDEPEEDPFALGVHEVNEELKLKTAAVVAAALRAPGHLSSLQRLQFVLPERSWGDDDDDRVDFGALCAAQELVRSTGRTRLRVDALHDMTNLNCSPADFTAFSLPCI